MTARAPKGVQIKATLTMLTPAEAKRLLARNTGNRNLRPEVVSQYARDMAEGRWFLTGDGIRIAADGRILDGQHRLAAIVASGTPVSMYVFTGVPEEAMVAMDSGAKRTAADYLGLTMGEESAPVLAAVARIALDMERLGTASRGSALSSGEIAEWVRANPDVRLAVHVAGRSARHMDAAPATVGYCALLFGRVDSTARDEFFYGATTGEGLTRGDARLALSRRLADARRNRERLARDVQISMFFRTWNAWIRDESMTVLRIRSGAGGQVEIPKLLGPRGNR